jgi:hypothetical protein
MMKMINETNYILRQIRNEVKETVDIMKIIGNRACVLLQVRTEAAVTVDVLNISERS